MQLRVQFALILNALRHFLLQLRLQLCEHFLQLDIYHFKLLYSSFKIIHKYHHFVGRLGSPGLVPTVSHSHERGRLLLPVALTDQLLYLDKQLALVRCPLLSAASQNLLRFPQTIQCFLYIVNAIVNGSNPLETLRDRDILWAIVVHHNGHFMLSKLQSAVVLLDQHVQISQILIMKYQLQIKW